MKYLSPIAVAGALAALAAGCVSPPPPHSPTGDLAARDRFPVPGRFTAASTAAVNLVDGWVGDFTDARLPALVQEALDHNRDLRAAAARVEAARALARVEAAGLRPQLSGRFEAARRQSLFFDFPSFGTPGATGGDAPPAASLSTSYGLGLDATWELDLWGRLRNNAAGALADAEAAAADARGARLSIAAQTAQAWLDAVTTRLQLRLARETEESFAANARVIARRYDQGLSDALDLRLIRSSAAAARSAVALQHRALDSRVRQVETLLGRYPAGALNAATNLPSLRRPVPAGLPDSLLTRRPDITAAERRWSAAGARRAAAARDRLPGISLTGSAGTSSDELESLTDEDYEVWSLAATLRQPFYTGGRIRSARRQAEARERAAAAEYASTVLTAFREVESSLQAERDLARQIEALRAAAEDAEAAETLAWERYQQGLVDIITVLETQRRTFDTRSRLLEIRNARLQNRITLYLALGGAPNTHAALSSEDSSP